MLIVSPRPIREFYRKHPQAEEPMRQWLVAVRRADWHNFRDVRQTFSDADAVPMRSGETATIFNVGGNKYRLACSIKYPIHRVYVRRVMTHAEYDTNAWHNDF